MAKAANPGRAVTSVRYRVGTQRSLYSYTRRLGSKRVRARAQAMDGKGDKIGMPCTHIVL